MEVCITDDLPRAHVAHCIPHRLRVQVPSRKGQRDYFEEAIARLRILPLIRSINASFRAGSIAIAHDGHARDVARMAREQGVFELPEAAVTAMLAEAAPVRIVGIDPRSAVSAGLAELGVVQAVRGNILGSGVEHLWHAYGAARILGSFRIAALMALLGAYQMSRGRVLNPAASLFFYALMVRAMKGWR